jgi:glycosyltransferase involved in cell wall biosynthesis
MNDPQLTFSIIIPTRNRAQLFLRALRSVEAQRTDNKFSLEVCVVNDGSEQSSLNEYSEIIEKCSLKLNFKLLEKRPNGHGPGFARNEAVSLATGNILCFLDDDDEWTDTEHLFKAFNAISKNNLKSVLFITNQTALDIEGNVKQGPIWTEDLIEKLNIIPPYSEISIKQLMLSSGFTHMNCLIVSKSIYESIGGYDESLRYEGDRDLFMRLSNSAERILFSPDYIANHYIPDQSKQVNTSTLVNQRQKLLYQISSNQKLLSLPLDKTTNTKCRKHLSDSFKKLAELYYQEHNYAQASLFSNLALASRFTFKWAIFSILVTLKKWTKRHG